MFCYLGTTITEHDKNKGEIVKRISEANKAFHCKKSFLTSSKVSLSGKKNFIQTYVWSAPLYGRETWKTQLEKKEYWKLLKCVATEECWKSHG